MCEPEEKTRFQLFELWLGPIASAGLAAIYIHAHNQPAGFAWCFAWFFWTDFNLREYQGHLEAKLKSMKERPHV